MTAVGNLLEFCLQPQRLLISVLNFRQVREFLLCAASSRFAKNLEKAAENLFRIRQRCRCSPNNTESIEQRI